MDVVEMRLFSWEMNRVKIYTYIYQKKNKKIKQNKKTPFATTVTNVRNTCTEVLAVNP